VYLVQDEMSHLAHSEKGSEIKLQIYVQIIDLPKMVALHLAIHRVSLQLSICQPPVHNGSAVPLELCNMGFPLLQ